MASPSAIFLLIVLATAAASAAMSTAPSAASSVQFSEKSVSEHEEANPIAVEFSEKSASEHEEANRKRDIIIDGACTDVKCCGDLCKGQNRYARTVNVAYRVINGKHRCFCSIIF